MKKMISIALVLVLCFALAGSALADFTPSVTYKPAPDLYENATADDGCKIVGYVTGEGEQVGAVHYSNGHLYATVEEVHETGCGEGHKCLIVTPLSIAEDDEEIPAASKDLLLRVYEQLLAQGMSFIDCPDLDAYIKQELGEDKTVEDLVVRDLFDVSVLCQELTDYLEPQGNVICLDFELGLEPGTFVAVVVYKNDQWQLIEDVEILEDGTVTCTTFEHFCPVAILVEDTEASDGARVMPTAANPSEGGHVPASTDAPETGADAGSNVVLWSVVAAAAAAALVVLFVMQRKSKKQ